MFIDVLNGDFINRSSKVQNYIELSFNLLIVDAIQLPTGWLFFVPIFTMKKLDWLG